MKELREAVRSALKRMEEAHASLESADESADLEALRSAFDEAETEHRSAKIRLERAERVEEARKAAPVEPVAEVEERKLPAGETKVGDEPLTYERHNGNSIVTDLYRARLAGDSAAQQRLERHMAEMDVERRDLSSTDSAGGYLVAPLYLQDEFVSFLRAGRVVANTIGSKDLPPKTDSINLPTMDGGTGVGTQADNGAVTETDATFNTVAADVKTIAGMQDVSQQVLDRSIPGIDGILFADLAKAYGVKLDSQVITNSTSNNKGLLDVTGINAVTFTQGTPTVGLLYPKLADAVQQIHTGIFMAPNAIFMHPRRWAWILAAVDTTTRPLVTPYAPQNSAASHGGVVSEGPVGSIQGLPVYVDSNIPTTLGASTNEDRIIVCRTDELYLWEDNSGPFLDTFRDVGSGTLTVRFRLFNYWAQCHARRPKAVSVISGTGLVAPTF